MGGGQAWHAHQKPLMTDVPRRSSTIQGMKGKIMLIWKGGVLLSSRIPSIGFFGSGVGFLAVGAIRAAR